MRGAAGQPGEIGPPPGRCSLWNPQFEVNAPSLTAARVAALWQPDRTRGSASRGTCSASIPTRHADGQEGSLLLMPSPRKALLHALPVVLEAVVGPLVVFYLLLVLTGFRGALIAALTWSYLALGRRLLRGERVSMLLLFGTILITLRTVIALRHGERVSLLRATDRRYRRDFSWPSSSPPSWVGRSRNALPTISAPWTPRS